MKKTGVGLLILILLAAAAYAEPKKNLIAVNLQDVELPNVVKFISDVTGKNFIFDETLKGKVTIMAPSKISSDEAFALFTSVLNLKGYTTTPAPGNLLKIVPAAQSKTASPEAAGALTEAYITKLIPLNYISADNALKFFQPLISKDGHISSFGAGNYILLVENALNVQRIEHILSFVDQPLLKDDPELYQIKYGAAEDMAKTITESLQRKDRAGVGNDEIRVMADPRLNALVLIGSNYAKESIKKLISLLDVPQKDLTGNIKVYFLENADAVELSKVLESVVKTIEEKLKQPQDTKSKVVITPDKATNSLIINAPAGLYQNLLAIIKDLDKRRRQVFVEAMIVEASLDRLEELGSKWRSTAFHNGEPVVVGGFGTMNSTSMLEVINGLSGMTVGGMGNFFSVPVTQGGTTTTLTIPGFSALFSASEFKDVVNVLSTPQILTSDNREAEIVVGENVPFISKRETNTTGTTSGSLFNVIERKDVGIMLKLTPQITEGEYVKLDLYQEISSLKQESSVKILTEVGPTTTKRSTRTSVVVRDKQTVVISGLMQEKVEEAVTKLPLLGDVPLLGYLFKFKSVNKTKTNLVVFLTPHIIRDAADLAALSERKRADFVRPMPEGKPAIFDTPEPQKAPEK